MNTFLFCQVIYILYIKYIFIVSSLIWCPKYHMEEIALNCETYHTKINFYLVSILKNKFLNNNLIDEKNSVWLILIKITHN